MKEGKTEDEEMEGKDDGNISIENLFVEND